jgi:hypothetical protein
MTNPVAHSTRRTGALLLADISGYTAFLQGVADAHRQLIVEADEPPPAYAVLSHLLDTMLGAIAPTFQLAKFEGDAIFAVTDQAAPHGAAALDCLHACYAAFRGQLATAGSQWTCSCAACARIGDLDLKFVLHHGPYVAQPISGREELLGAEVNLVHRLLKNHVRELIGPVAYALMTDRAIEAMEIPTDGMVATDETYADVPRIPVHVLPLGAPAEGEGPVRVGAAERGFVAS